MKKLNKKGFTLIELLAVIVVLAIIMVIAATQVGKAIETARNGAFESSYKMIIKEIKNKVLENDIASGSETIACTGDDCNTIYDLSKDYSLTVTKIGSTNNYAVVLKPAASNSKFSNINIKCPVSSCFSSSTTGNANVVGVKVDSEAKVTVLSTTEMATYDSNVKATTTTTTKK